MVIFDFKMGGESATCPRLRVPPYSAEQMKEYIHIALSLHADDSGLRLLPGVTHLHFLGFKSIASQIRNAYIDESQADRHLQKIKCHCRDMSILWDEDSLLERRASIQGQIEQKESLLQITSTLLEVGVALPKVSRQPFPGSNIGDALGYASFHKWGESLHMTFKDTRKALGSRRVEVGGKSPELQKRGDLDMEPHAFHEMSETVYEVLFRELKGFATIDFTPGGGVLSFLHIKVKRHYAAVTWSESHRQALYAHLFEKTFRAMLDPESPCADAGLIALLADKSATDALKKGKKENETEENGATPASKEVTPKKNKKSEKKEKVGAETVPGEPAPKKAKKEKESPAKPSGRAELEKTLQNLQKSKGDLNVLGADVASEDDDSDEEDNDDD